MCLLTEPCPQSNFYKRQYLVQQILPVCNLDLKNYELYFFGEYGGLVALPVCDLMCH